MRGPFWHSLLIFKELPLVRPRQPLPNPMPRRLRVYFRYDRSLLGKLSRAAYGTVCDVYRLDPQAGNGVPAMVSAVQTFGNMMNFNPHVHSVVAEGVFLETGEFVALPDAQMHRAEEFWRERVFALLLDSHKIDEATAGSMRTWPHSGFTAPVRGAALRAAL